MIKMIPVITIDGPSGAGKGKLCQEITNILKWNFLDSGAIYRALALLALENQINTNSEEDLCIIAMHLKITFYSENGKVQVILENKDISEKIRSQTISNLASRIAILPRLREVLLSFQRKFRVLPGLVTDGRDMGSIVFPDALVKIFLDASLSERVNRRKLQLQNNGFSVNFNNLVNQIQERDERDYYRSTSPLLLAPDALKIDSTNIPMKQVLKIALSYVYEKLTLL
ncbi:Cytidylate kinase [Candidatus Erwinia haradaeae]|uniref:Cytidylate kinase n=1 Tax=Candidatus Erwinia haradaeae TaxID=1922217 RepID=A0A451CZY2_9GAMM|nr:(d)CMP kinase [Candidatus Erwinia haradaeae]VFP79003.1 Cytidylate kinase [Candidatus Erwinia haradaeae]